MIGNLGMNPEVKTLDSGKKMARFTIATNDTYKNQKGEKVTNTSWHNIVAWDKLADILGQYVEKGMEIALEGKLTTRSYIDKDGSKKYITEIIAQEMLMLGYKK